MRTYDVGLDVHRASLVIVVLNGAGKIVMQSVIETSAERVREYLKQPWRPKMVSRFTGRGYRFTIHDFPFTNFSATPFIQ
jgi:hypothetical protein